MTRLYSKRSIISLWQMHWTVKMAHEMLPGSKVGCMIARFCYYPATCRPEDVMQQIHDEQYTNWYFTDVMARGYYPEYILNYFERKNIQIQMEPGDEELLRKYTVDLFPVPTTSLRSLPRIPHGKRQTAI